MRHLAPLIALNPKPTFTLTLTLTLILTRPHPHPHPLALALTLTLTLQGAKGYAGLIPSDSYMVFEMELLATGKTDRFRVRVRG